MERSENPNWPLEYRCPQCGAPACLDETARLFQCPYCRVKLFFSPGDHFRYVLVPSQPLRPGVLYVPYWRLKGTIFTCEGLEIRARYVDGTVRAVEGTALPVSLGVRPRALALRFASPGLEGCLVREDRKDRAALAELEKAFCEATGLGTQGAVVRKAFVGDSSSIVATPVYECGGMVEDGVTGEMLPAEIGGAPWDRIGAGEAASKAVTFIPAICPTCGWNLTGEGDSEVMLCGNCNSAWTARGHDLTGVPFGVVGQRRKGILFLPFWSIRAKVRGIALSSYGDLVRFANVPKVVVGGAAQEGLYFWVPAFKVRGELLLRLSRLMTLAQPKGPGEQELPNAYLYPVTLGESEAKELLPILIAALAMARKKVFPMLAETSIEAQETVLSFLPFQRQGNELVSTLFPYTVAANALQYGRNL